MDPTKRHPKYKHMTVERLTELLWLRAARFGQLQAMLRSRKQQRRAAAEFCLPEQRAMIARLGEDRSAEVVLAELRQNPDFVIYEAEQARQKRQDERREAAGRRPKMRTRFTLQAMDIQVTIDGQSSSARVRAVSMSTETITLPPPRALPPKRR